MELKAKLSKCIVLEEKGDYQNAFRNYVECLQLILSLLLESSESSSIQMQEQLRRIPAKQLFYFAKTCLERSEIVQSKLPHYDNNNNQNKEIYAGKNSLRGLQMLNRRSFQGNKINTNFHRRSSSRIQMMNFSSMKTLGFEEMVKFAKVFKFFDKRNRERIDLGEFQKGLSYFGIGEFSKHLFQNFSLNGMELTQSQFVSKTKYFFSSSFSEEKIAFSFSLFATSQGYITQDNFVKVISGLFEIIQTMRGEMLFCEDDINKNKSIIVAHIISMFKQIDTAGKGVMTFDQFRNAYISKGNLLKELGLKDHTKLNYRTVSNKIGSPVFFNDPKFKMVLQMMTGISITLDEFSEKNKFCKREFSRVFTVEIKNDVESLPPASFTAYAPVVFANFRKLYGVNEAEFRNSFGIEQVLGNFILGNLTTLGRKKTEGKSGNHFFSSHNGLFIAKTISYGEAMHFKKNLDEFYYHLISNPDSLLCRIYGLFKIDSIYFIIIQNVFSTKNKMDVVYDLKGSTLGRTNSGSGTKKDLDLTQRGEMFRVGIEKANEILNTISKDVKFLETMGIIDYSLVVGVHNIKQNTINIVKSGQENIDGGVRSIDERRIYYFGIIDNLINYGFKKQAESVLKNILYSRTGQSVSVVEPTQYSMRFYNFMKTIFTA